MNNCGVLSRVTDDDNNNAARLVEAIQLEYVLALVSVMQGGSKLFVDKNSKLTIYS